MERLTYSNGIEEDDNGEYVHYNEAQAEIDELKTKLSHRINNSDAREYELQAVIAELKKENKFITEGSDRALKVQQAEIDDLVYELKLAREMSDELPPTAGLRVTQKAWDTLLTKHKGGE